MYKKLLITLASVILVVTFIILFVYSNDDKFTKELVVDGNKVKVSLFTFPKPIRIELIYKPRTDLEKYSWLKPLLFQLNGYELTIPESEWSKYGEGEWPQERYVAIRKYNKRIHRAIEENKEFWGGVYSELTNLTICKFDNETFLVAKVTSRKRDGVKFGSTYEWLIKRDGHWVRTSGKNPKGKNWSSIVAHSFSRAVELSESCELKSRPVEELD